MKLGHQTKINCDDVISSAVQAAVADLQRDLRWCCKQACENQHVDLYIDPLIGREQFLITTHQDRIQCAGGDDLGLIYAIYEISERFLEVPPLWFWMEVPHRKRDERWVEPGLHIDSGKPVFEYRGWFLNDEDLLHHWSPSPNSGISQAAYDKVYEAILRCRGNMVLPGTYLFADEPAWAWAAQRGLTLTEHHHEGLGLNVFRWPHDQPFDLINQPELVEHAWDESVQAKLSHGSKVVWALGQRGRGDWALDKELPELKGRYALQGKLLSEVIRRQIDVVERHDPNPSFVLYTWMELAQLYEDGHLDLPEHVKLVWADYHGGNGRVIEPNRPRRGDGVYYHVAMHGCEKGHLVSWMPISRIREEFTRYQNIGATHYMLINVSNVRPFSIAAKIALRWCYTGVNDQVIHSVFKSSLGIDPIAGEIWYESLTSAAPEFGRLPGCIVGDEGPLNATCHVLFEMLKSDEIDDAQILECWRGSYLPFTRQGDESDVSHLSELIERINRVVQRLETCEAQGNKLITGIERHDYPGADYFLCFQPRFLASLWRMWATSLEALLAQKTGHLSQAQKRVEQVASLSQAQHQMLHEHSRGQWLGFYDGGQFSPTRLPYAHAQRVLAILDGQKAPDQNWAMAPWNAYDIFQLIKAYQGDRKISLPLLSKAGSSNLYMESTTTTQP